MKILKELLIILTFVFIGEILSRGFQLPLPGNIIGMLLLLAALISKKLKLHSIEHVADFLLSHMAVMFIPAGVGIITIFSYIQDVWVWIFLIAIVSTLLVMIATALTVNLIMKRQERMKE